MGEQAGDLTVIRGARVYDGTGTEGITQDVAIKDGLFHAIGEKLEIKGDKEIDANGLWLTPGFVDIHTHYDAEIEADPGLKESVRHGVTTVVMGNCSLSLALGGKEALIDIFSRVENLSKKVLSKWLEKGISWTTPKQYYQHLDSLPLGPNVASFLGHSNLRIHAMGPKRSLMRVRPTEKEMQIMRSHLEEALEEGYLGLSIDMLPWHRMEGRKYGGVSIPSQRARHREYADLASICREKGAILQATPNANEKQSVVYLMFMSAGLFRRPLKLTALAALDFASNRMFPVLTRVVSFVTNRLLAGNFRFQALSGPFEVWCDGFRTPVFEEFEAGERLMTEDRLERRRALLSSPKFREKFRKQWVSPFNRSFHRDLAKMWVTEAPDSSFVGKSFKEIASMKKKEPIECFLDLLLEYDDKIRWHTVLANDRPSVLRKILKAPYNIPGFSDAGAHNRNMAFQHAHLRLIKDAMEHDDGLSVPEAISSVTGKVGAWLGLDCGTVKVGKKADLCLLDPEKLKTDLSRPKEVNDPLLEGEMRMVVESGGVVNKVFVSGREVFDKGAFAGFYGKEKVGALLRASRR